VDIIKAALQKKKKKKSYILAWSVSDDFILTLPET
jgi:hypothetical protein